MAEYEAREAEILAECRKDNEYWETLSWQERQRLPWLSPENVRRKQAKLLAEARATLLGKLDVIKAKRRFAADRDDSAGGQPGDPGHPPGEWTNAAILHSITGGGVDRKLRLTGEADKRIRALHDKGAFLI